MGCDVQRLCTVDQNKCAVCWDTHKCDVPTHFQEFWDFKITPALAEPRIMLRVGLLPPVAQHSSGVWCHPAGFTTGDELALGHLELVPPNDPLFWRYAEKRSRASSNEPSDPKHSKARSWWSSSTQAEAEPAKVGLPSVVGCPPPDCGLAAPVVYWRVKVNSMDCEGNVTEHPCLLQAAKSSHERTTCQSLSVLDKSAATAIYADKFNSHMAAVFYGEVGSQISHDEEQELQDGPLVRIAIPVGCVVISSLYPEILELGDNVVLFPYPPLEIQKLVFEEPGHNALENTLEIPQAFFHFVAHLSRGRQLVWDLQGCTYEDGSVILMDPCLLQRSNTGQEDTELFHRLHPECSSLCLTFVGSLRPAGKLRCSPGNSHCLTGPQCMTEGLVAWARCAESWARHNVPAAMRCKPDPDYDDETPGMIATAMNHHSMMSESNSISELQSHDYEMSPRVAHEALIVGKPKMLGRSV
eukprot:CAMPEP_0172895900 /NCGR_PEP_ID=MMETSP1075-20121228/154155_1 /TAXON_ID=2916 /ORGANISM="Ceratium fusus, Strain PA161109" /LENGTH=468 /DNA_ID=CAMNT_0013751199 /DNA_START=73 /DNA_END=1476 /DNA_ORIENTATION=+